MAAPLDSAPKGDSSLVLSMPGNEVDASGTQSQSHGAVEDIIFGSIAGAVGKVFEYPFDTVKVRLQSQSASVYVNSFDCFRKAVQSDGVVRGLYRGLSAPVFGAAVETSSLFFSYGIAQDVLLKTAYTASRMREDLPMDALLAAGAISGAFTSLWLTPIELVKCQMQVPLVPGTLRGPGVLSVIGNVFRHNGALGFWHGQMGTLIREAGGSAAWFGAYEGSKKFFKNRNMVHAPAHQRSDSSTSTVQTGGEIHLWQQLIAGASAGVAYNFAFFPADTIKSRMQTVKVGPGDVDKRIYPGKVDFSNSEAASTAPRGVSSGRGPTFWKTGAVIWNEAGIRGLYRGCAITLARSSLSSPIIFGIYEAMKGWSDR